MWIKGEPTDEGSYYACFITPYCETLTSYGEIYVWDGKITHQEEPVTKVHAWYEVPFCPYDPANKQALEKSHERKDKSNRRPNKSS